MSGTRKKVETIHGELTDGTTTISVTIQITLEADWNFGWERALADTTPVKAAQTILGDLRPAKKAATE